MVLAHPTPSLGFLVQSKGQMRRKGYYLSYSTPDIQIFRSKVNRSPPQCHREVREDTIQWDASPGGGDMSQLHCPFLGYMLRSQGVIHTSALTLAATLPFVSESSSSPLQKCFSSRESGSSHNYETRQIATHRAHSLKMLQ